jgi:hypothetical protein
MQKNTEKYFAAKSGEDTAKIVLQKANSWFHNLDVNGYLDKLKSAWMAYHGAYYTDVGSGHKITFGGEQDELTNLAVNHYRNICRHMLTMVTANRPAMDARATNTDYKSLVQTKLANGLLDYYMREKRLEDYLSRAVEHAIVFGTGYIKMEWNATSGEVYDMIEPEYEMEKTFNPNTGEEIEQQKLDIDGNPIKVNEGYPIYEGDVMFSTVSPFDVVFDSTKEDPSKHDWVLVRSFKNKFDLAAKYPEYEDEILKQETKSDKERYNFTGSFYDQTDDIAVYEFYHKKTESMPDGRYLLFVESNVILMDSPMPYRKLPVYRISPGDILGTPYGYTDTFDLLPIQDALNSLYSTILTNQNTFGVQNILSPRGADINPQSLAGGLNFIEYNHQIGEPKALNLTSTPPEIFNFIGILEKAMETVSGVNSVSRGNPEASLQSGNALALVQSMSLQFISGLQQSYVKLIEDVGTGMIQMLQDFASVPRVATIVGKSNRTYMKEFSGKDLSSINRIIVDVGNPLAKTTAGRVQMAEQMLQMNLIKTPEAYISVINTGKLETMTDGIDRQFLLVKAENEKMVAGETVQALDIEPHSLHIKEHRDILADPDLKQDPDLVQRVLAHIQEHIDALRNADPDLLMHVGEQPLSPPGGTPTNQPDPAGQINQGQMGQTPDMMQQQPMAPEIPLPQPANPPAPFENNPTNPQDMLPQS